MDSYGFITLGKFGLLRAALLFVGVSVGGLVIVACLCVLIWWCLVVFVASAVVGGLLAVLIWVCWLFVGGLGRCLRVVVLRFVLLIGGCFG